MTEAGDSTAGASPGEFVFVFGFDNRLWCPMVLWLLPMVLRCGGGAFPSVLGGLHCLRS